MPQKGWSPKRERQYEHVKDSLDISSGRRGGLRSHRGAGGRTKAQLYNEARRMGVKGRSTMTKEQLQRAVDG